MMFSIQVTFSVLFEATNAVVKIGVYDEVKERSEKKKIANNHFFTFIFLSMTF